MKNMYNKFIAWLLLETPKTDAINNNGLVYKETPSECEESKMTKPKKKAPAKKAPTKKAPVKKAPVKKAPAKKAPKKK